MLEDEILDQTLQKKNREIATLKQKNEDLKQEYDAKIKNLMGSITSLKTKNENLEKESHENVRVDIIKRLKEERKNQESVISLLRKYINNDGEVDKYLIKEFKKNGEQRFLTYEELHIKYKNVLNEYKKLKLGLKDTNYKKTKKNSTLYDSTKKSRKSLQGIDDMTLQLKVVEKFKDQIEEYDEKIDKLQTENEELKLQKSKMENMQNQVFEKLKKYTEETSNMKNMYDIIKKDIQEDSFTKINDLNLKLNKSEEENKKLKERIYELINIGENAQKSERDRLIKVQRDNDIYAKLLDTKKKEIEIYKEELEKFRGNLEKLDGRDTKKIKKLENQNDLITKNKNELEANINNLNNIIEQKDNQINNLKNTIEALSEQNKIKDEEITLLNEKIKEFEEILNKKIINYNKLNI